MLVTPRNDGLVKDIKLYNLRPWFLHGYGLPFLFGYAAVGFAWLNLISEEKFEVNIILAAAVFLLQVLSVLFCFWSVEFRCIMMYSKNPNPLTASFAKVIPEAHNGSTELVKIHKRKTKETTKVWIEFQKVIYVFDGEEKKVFLPIEYPVNNTFRSYQNWKGFVDEDQCKASKEIYGDNVMQMVIPEFKELFLERATAPFFVFQVFCVVLWCLDEYWYYSLFTLCMLVAFEASLVYQQLRNMAEIRKMGNKPYSINVYRNRKWRHVPSDTLVAGDIVSVTRSPSELGKERNIPCDVLLLRGRIIVDEAMLTGESVPQMKEPIEDVDPDTVLDLSTHSRLHLISGGTKVVQHEPPAKSSSGSGQKEGASRPPDNGCVGYVVRTGFNTSQGKLLRTILFGVKRVTANNLETFAFIMFLLIFAIVASSYVWIVGSADPKRNRYKLVLNCVLILTSVVPPELPIELSLAVNSSLLALSKLYVYCTEPFRIPFAGKIDICCFDKTGTLTSDKLVVEGIAGVSLSNGNEDEKELCPVTSSPPNTQRVLATCHALVNMDDELVGDPLEQAMLKAVEWNLTKGDVVIPRKKTAGLQPLKVVQRFHFSSLLKRMSTIVSQEEQGSVGHNYMVTVKGAAETLKPMFSRVPEFYDAQHQSLSQRGARVLALGIRQLGKGLSPQQIRAMKRDEVEGDLEFAGFVIVSCPLKSDTKAVMKELRNASHHMTMITGDNPLTACHVGRVLRFTGKQGCLILTNDDGAWLWRSVDRNVEYPLDPNNLKNILKKNYDLCLTGQALSHLENTDSRFLKRVLPNVRIFARVSPKQKEQVIVSLKNLGFTLLMCGDGTNDVGALKHANVGVALLSNPPEHVKKDERNANGTTSNEGGVNRTETDKNDSGKVANRGRQRQHNLKAVDKGQPRGIRNRLQQRQDELARKQKKVQEMLGEMEADPQVVKMGDASIAAPFSYKLSSTAAICHIIKQGRCTLVTTLQMFKILALNALVLAYSQSVLYLDGVKFSDAQATLQGLLLAGCFLFISRSKPMKVLSKQRPLPNIFNVYTIATITSQFAIHFASLFYLVKMAKEKDPREEIDLEADFAPNLLNSTVYVLSLATQIITFAINYRGHPFMESLFENKPLLYSLAGSGSFLLALVTNALPDVNAQFEIIEFDNEFRILLLQVISAILVSSWTLDRSLRFLIGGGSLRRLH